MTRRLIGRSRSRAFFLGSRSSSSDIHRLKRANTKGSIVFIRAILPLLATMTDEKDGESSKTWALVALSL